MKTRNKGFLSVVLGATLFAIVLLIILVLLLTHHQNKPRYQKSNPQDQVGSFARQLSGEQAQAIRRHVDKALNEQAIKNRDFTQKSVKEAVAEALKKFNQEQRKNANHNDSSVSFEQLQQRVTSAVNNAISPYEAKIKDLEQQLQSKAHGNYQLNGAQDHGVAKWIGDVSKEDEKKKLAASVNPLGGNFDIFSTSAKENSGSDSTLSENRKSQGDYQSDLKKSEPVAYYTIPANSVMSGVIPLQPLIGQIPRGNDHSVFRAFRALFVSEHPTLMAQGHQAPMNVAKMQGSAVCVGDYVSSSVMCAVDSLTFIFPDGHYQTIEAKEKNSANSQSQVLQDGLGNLTDAFGNPQIQGELKSTLGLRLGIRSLTAGISAYGQGIAQSQVNTGSGITGLTQQIANATQYAQGKAISGAASGAQDELNDLSKNMFDYVFVPNWNPKTQRLIRLNIVVREPIKIDYDKKGRTINHESNTQNHSDSILF